MRTKINKLFILLIICALLFTLCFSLSSTSVVLSDDNSNTVETSENENITSFAEKISSIDQKLNDLAKNSNAKSKSNKDWLKNNAGNIEKGMQTSFDIIDSLVNDEEPDTAKLTSKAVRTILVCVANCWGLGGVAGTIYDEIEDLTSQSAPSLNEIEEQSDNINQSFNEVTDKLYEINRDVYDLSLKMDDSVNQIIKNQKKEIENAQAKSILSEFYSDLDGNFSYKELKNYLYGSPDYDDVNILTTYNYNLNFAIQHNYSEEKIKKYFDELYLALYTSFNRFMQYYTGDKQLALEKSIVKYYYDYLSANPSLVPKGSTAEMEAIEFAYDVYNTCLEAYNVLAKCYHYQASEMCLDAKLNGTLLDDGTLSDGATYELINGTEIQYVYIKAEQAKYKTKYLYDAEEQIMDDLAYILNIDGSYIIQDKYNNSNIYDIVDYGTSSKSLYGSVPQKFIVYLNKFPDSINEIFGFDASRYSFYSDYGTEIDGIFDTSNRSGKYECTLYYKEDGRSKVVYSITFNIGAITDRFNGGNGSRDNPYLISNETQFINVGKNLNASYKLLNNLNYNNRVVYPIGTKNDPYNGIFDGNGFEISGLSIVGVPFDETRINMQPTIGLFGAITENSEIKNLTLYEINVSYTRSLNEDSQSNFNYYIGGVVGFSQGVITNCSVKGGSTITIESEKKIDFDRNIYIYAGGIAGYSKNNISYCSIQNLTMDVNSTLIYRDNYFNNKQEIYSGGVVGYTESNVKFCRVGNTTKIDVFASATGDSTSIEKPFINVFMGGIIGNNNPDKLQYVYSDILDMKSECEVFNKGIYRDQHRYDYDNVKVNVGKYYSSYNWFFVNEYPTEEPYSIKFDLKDIREKYSQKIEQYTEVYNDIIDDISKRWNVKLLKWDNSKNTSRYDYSQDLSFYDQQVLINEINKEIKKYNDIVYRDADLYYEAYNDKEKDKYLEQMKTDLLRLENMYRSLAHVETKRHIMDLYDEANDKCEAGINAISEYYSDSFNNNIATFDVAVNVQEGAEIKINSNILDKDALIFSPNNVNNILSKVNIVNYYGFTSKITENENHEEIHDINVTIVFTATINGISQCFIKQATMRIEDDYIIADPEVANLRQYYNKGETFGMDLANGIYFNIIYHYASGDKSVEITSMNEITVEGFNTIDYTPDFFEYTITYQGVQIKAYAMLRCMHTNLIKTKTVVGDCCHIGHDEYECQTCGKIIDKNITNYGGHNYQFVDGRKPTCFEAGTTGYYVCSICKKQITINETLQELPHDYCTIEAALRNDKISIIDANKYSSNEYHYCCNGNHFDKHSIVVEESVNEYGNRVYTYYCLDCGYHSEIVDDNLILKNGNIPQICVSDGYVKNTGDTVIVYIQLLNNPGINGASFGIRYTDGLELVPNGIENGNLISDVFAYQEVYKGCNFVWATSGKDYTEDGYLVKLKFKVISENRENQKIEVVYVSQTIRYENGKSDIVESGFSTTQDGYGIQKFIAKDGTIYFSDYLPGDINNDGVVNVADAMYMAKQLASEGVLPSKKVCDVNLDGKVNLLDIICILQYCNGSFGTNLVNSKYEVTLYLNGFDDFNCPTTYLIDYYDDDGNINTWNEAIGFDVVNDNMNRLGYKFKGWYNQLVDGTTIDTTKPVQYLTNLKKQTLYAYWEMNEIEFNMNGATSKQIQEIKFDTSINPDHDQEINFNNYIPSYSYDISYILIEQPNEEYRKGKISKTFLGWYNEETGLKVTDLDLTSYNLGKVKLRAEWSESFVWNKPKETETGYLDVSDWYKSNIFSEDSIVKDITSEFEQIPVVNGIRILYGKKNLKEYNVRIVESSKKSNTNFSEINTKFTIKNYKSMTLTPDDTNEPLYEFDYWTALGKKLDFSINDYTYYLDSNEELVLTANWIPRDYTVTYQTYNNQIVIPNGTYNADDLNVSLPNIEWPTDKEYNIFEGWYIDDSFSEEYSELFGWFNIVHNGNMTLYAKWTHVSVTVTIYRQIDEGNMNSPRTLEINLYEGKSMDDHINITKNVQNHKSAGIYDLSGKQYYDKDGDIIQGINLKPSEDLVLVEKIVKDSGELTYGTKNATSYTIYYYKDEYVKSEEQINTNINTTLLKNCGYKYLHVTLTFDYKVDDWGSQLIQIKTVNGTDIITFNREWKSNSSWQTETVDFYLKLTDLSKNGAFMILWGLSKDETSTDQWQVGYRTIEFEAVTNESN